jgi:hypothetical protein
MNNSLDSRTMDLPVELSGALLGDKRLNKRLSLMLERMQASPRESFPQMLSSSA